ncbi:hypothetical protein [Prosthecobacter sp.]|jgi:hypothetical protein|uniref:hypothetical protein n=1 Tax=Prosthecobacter sp. TaxID=1965333 RepID=UPI003782FB66
MIIQLLKNNIPVLTARSAHRQGNAYDILPITYEGEASLITPSLKMASVDLLESVFSLLARKHGLELSGDYDAMMIKHNLKP